MSEVNHNLEWNSIFEEFQNRLKTTAQLIISEMEGDGQQSELYKVQSLMKASEECKRKILFENDVLTETKQALNDLEKPWECDIEKIFEDKITSQSQQSQSTSLSGVEEFMNFLKMDVELRTEDGLKTDPWTKLPIQDPVQCNSCKHLYERKIVLGVLKKKKEFRCPYLGCIQVVKQSNIIDVNF